MDADRRPRVGVHTTALRPDHGGGLLYAAALARVVDGELLVPFAVDDDALRRALPAWAIPEAVRQVETDLPRPGELRRALRDRSHQVCVLETSHVPRLSFAPQRVVLTSFPFATPDGWRDRVRLARIPRVIANSGFTAHWVRERWGREADVLHPPVAGVPPGTKRRMILSVGRFTGGGRSKCQRELVEAFARLGPDAEGWELHLAGFVEDAAYFAAVEEAAADRAVVLHPDLDRTALERLYGEASLLWHACGLGVDQDREPQRVEHFGIVTAEAMTAGCVPVVIDRGGQPEIVGDAGDAGVLWHELDDLVGATRPLLRDDRRRSELAERARQRAVRFDLDAFTQRARTLVLGESAGS